MLWRAQRCGSSKGTKSQRALSLQLHGQPSHLLLAALLRSNGNGSCSRHGTRGTAARLLRLCFLIYCLALFWRTLLSLPEIPFHWPISKPPRDCANHPHQGDVLTSSLANHLHLTRLTRVHHTMSWWWAHACSLLGQSAGITREPHGPLTILDVQKWKHILEVLRIVSRE